MCTNAQSQSMSADAERREVGEERVGQCAALAREAVGATRHPVADREVPLLLADQQQCGGEFDSPVGGQQRDQRQLGAVDVPHRRDVEHEGPGGRPERALARGEARLDHEWYSAVLNTVRRSLEVVSTRIVSSCSDHAALVWDRRVSKL